MLDPILRRLIDPPLNKAASVIVNAGIGPNIITWVGFLCGLLACAFFIDGYYNNALIFLGLNRLADGLDGPVARASLIGPTDRGAFLDIVLDFVIYAGLPFCMAFHLASYAAWAATAFLLFSFICSGIAFMAFSLMAERRGLISDAQGKKGFYYLAGLMEGTETVLFLALMCILPDHYVTLAWGFGALCLISALGRIIVGIKKLGE